MQRAKTLCMLICVMIALLTPALLTRSVKADNGTAKVYILMLSGVGGSWVSSCEQVKDGAIEACMLKGEWIHQNVPRVHPEQDVDYPPYYSATPIIVTNWGIYKNVILNEAGVIVVNTHSQYLPVPNNYAKEAWADEIADAMLTRRLSWVHVAMYPFYEVKYENGSTETWGDNGFKYFMGHINKDNVDCWLPSGASSTWTTRVEHFPNSYGNNVIGNWGFGEGDESNGIDHFWHAEMGRPLKWSDFKDYIIMPLYQMNDTGTLDVYLPGAVMAFVNPEQRYDTSYGCGVYVHLGTRYFYTHDSSLCSNSDFGRGFIGTAAALWVEANRFQCSAGFWQKVEGNDVYNATIFVHPTVTWYESDSSYIYVKLGFGIHGIYKFPQGNEMAMWDKVFFDAWKGSSGWSDVQMKADINNPALSKQVTGFGTEVTELNTERIEEFRGLATSSIIAVASLPSGPAGWFFDGIGGVILGAQWASFLAGGTAGVDQYASAIEGMNYETMSLDSEPVDGYIYTETSSIVVTEIKIPTSIDRSGWMTLPITYRIELELVTGLNPWTEFIDTGEKTIQLAIYFDRGQGQKDANVVGDAGGDCSSARSIGFPTLIHGYLDGTADSVDCYNFSLSSSTRILAELTPPPYVDFNLQLISPSGTTWTSENGPGQTEYLELNAVQGMWTAKVYKASGSGVYSLLTNYAGGGGCPTLFLWNRTGYVEEGSMDIHSYNDITLDYRMQQSPVPVANLYRLKLAELDNFTSHIDQVKLYAIDDKGEWHLCPLILAYDTTQGVVTSKLLFDDDHRVNLKPTQETSLYFLKTIRLQDIEYFIFEINGYNPKQP